MKRTNGRENPDKEGKEETQKGQKVILLFNSFLAGLRPPIRQSPDLRTEALVFGAVSGAFFWRNSVGKGFPTALKKTP